MSVRTTLEERVRNKNLISSVNINTCSTCMHFFRLWNTKEHMKNISPVFVYKSNDRGIQNWTSLTFQIIFCVAKKGVRCIKETRIGILFLETGRTSLV